VATRIKKAKISLLFVEKLANSLLLAAFPASIRKILSLFSLAPHSRKGFLKMNELGSFVLRKKFPPFGLQKA
jgi:hypothetical protein